MTDYSTKSLQFIFNKISRHLLKQNAKATNERRGCVCYDVATQRRCAAGCLLPISYYKKNGNISLTGLTRICKVYDSPKYDLVKALQIIHDAYEVEEWPDEIRRIAKEFNLEVPSFLNDVRST